MSLLKKIIELFDIGGIENIIDYTIPSFDFKSNGSQSKTSKNKFRKDYCNDNQKSSYLRAKIP